jgi:hypothetical protein
MEEVCPCNQTPGCCSGECQDQDDGRDSGRKRREHGAGDLLASGAGRADDPHRMRQPARVAEQLIQNNGDQYLVFEGDHLLSSR